MKHAPANLGLSEMRNEERLVAPRVNSSRAPEDDYTPTEKMT
jgi:hypothetical protein